MEKDLIKLYDNVTYLNKDLAEYSDDKGNLKVLPIPALICGVEYVRFDEKTFNVFKYEKLIDKDATPNKVIAEIQVDKASETGKEKDRGTIINKDVELFEGWKVTNGLQFSRVFLTKEEAFNFVNPINAKCKEMLAIK